MITIRPDWRMSALAVFVAAFVVFMCASGASAEQYAIDAADWRYGALRELGSGGLLELSDALLYTRGEPVSLQQMLDSVERAILRLAGAASSGTIHVLPEKSAQSGPLRLQPQASQELSISPRQAGLLAELVAEFGPRLEEPVVAKLGLSPSAPYGGGSALVLTLEPVPAQRLGLEPLSLAKSTRVAAPLRSNGDQSDISSIRTLLASAVKPPAPLPDPQFQVGLPAPIGSVAVELSSQAARRPARPDSPADSVDQAGPSAGGFDFSTSVQLADILKVSAAFFTDDASTSRATSASVGVRLGEKEQAGFVVGHRVTEPVADPTKAVKETVTSVDVKYSLPDLTGRILPNDSITVRAGYEVYERGASPASAQKTSLQSTASLVIDYKLLLGDAAFLQAGYRYERMRDLIASGAIWTKSEAYDDVSTGRWPSGELLHLTGADATRTVTSIDFGYKLTGSTALLLGYKLIDFSEVGFSDISKNLATAEVTIRF